VAKCGGPKENVGGSVEHKTFAIDGVKIAGMHDWDHKCCSSSREGMLGVGHGLHVSELGRLRFIRV